MTGRVTTDWSEARCLDASPDMFFPGVGDNRAERSRRGIKLTGERAADVLRPCGTAAAYRRHQRRGEKPCRTCLAAHNEESDRRLTFGQRRVKAERQRRRRGAA